MTILEHELDPRDVAPAQANRQARAATKGTPLGAQARAAFDAKKYAITAAPDVVVTAAVVGGIPGFWCRPPNARPGAAILFLHGGGYVMGSARAFTNFAGQIAIRAGVDTFVADYRLAPEHRFPAALEDALAAYKGCAEQGDCRVAVVGDSAGGGLALALLAKVSQAESAATRRPAAAAVMSPWLDLALTGRSHVTRAEADPVFTREVLRDIASTYLGDTHPADPFASPLFGAMEGLPPIRIDVGDDEVVLDDSLRYAARAANAGVPVSVHVWKGMPHVFQTGIGRYVAAERSMDGIGAFLREHAHFDPRQTIDACDRWSRNENLTI
jgi:acetyl esterase/lipase